AQALLPESDLLITALAENIVARAAARRSAGDAEGALALLRQGLERLPESRPLTLALAEHTAALRQAREETERRQLAQLHQQAGTLLNQPWRNDAWEAELDAVLRDLTARLPPQDPGLLELRRRLAGLYVERAYQGIAGQRFAEARALLEKARGIDSQSAAFATLEQRLQEAETAFRQEQERQHLAATIQGLRQDFATRIKGNDAEAADKTLEQLARLLPKDDAFLNEEAPRALADVYLHLAERQAGKARYDDAVALLRRGIDKTRPYPDLQERLEAYRRDAAFAAAAAVAARGDAGALAGLAKTLADLERRYPDVYPKEAAGLEQALAQRIARLAPQDPSAALALHDAARALFPKSRALAGITIPAPVKPSAYAQQGQRLVTEGRLGEAQRLLREAQRQEPQHPGVKDFQQALERRMAQAQQAARDFQAALKRSDKAGAETQLKSIASLWKDHPDLPGYRQDLARLTPPPPVPEPKPEPVRPPPSKPPVASKNACEARLAGKGTRGYAVCFDLLPGGQEGPPMVVIPAGSGVGAAFAIGKYEVSVSDYNRYCQATKACKSVRGKGSMPVTGISARDAEGYARWLSQQTGFSYRLPTRAEWTHAAAAKGRGVSDYNCRLTRGSQIERGREMLPVRTGKANGWGVANAIGNAQEWVTGGSGYLAVGGSHLDSWSDCSVDLAKGHSGQGDDVTGFRLVRRL
nr:SUMF1/EgtB/PvdO family nonheme iron enzyme [Pseudomonadota bacterium]